jgi:hypothetical protein
MRKFILRWEYYYRFQLIENQIRLKDEILYLAYENKIFDLDKAFSHAFLNKP